MSDQIAISLNNVGKTYNLYASRLDAMLDVSGLSKIRFWKPVNFNQFWALRNINLEIYKGKRIGIIGRNGAGKTTLLKLISNNFAPSEGNIEVHGNVQALLQAGAGFHPEFTGYENVRAVLALQSLTKSEIEAAVKDIEEFTELGQFMEQPFKTFSSGMQARLTFAAATVLNPEILIIDEILGAGDGYFINKSNERMNELVVNSGATVLIVSHALDQILRLCEEVIWLERGKIAQSGPAIEVIKAYQQYLNNLEERNIKSRNIYRSNKRQVEQFNLTEEKFTLNIINQGAHEVALDVSKIILREDEKVIENLSVGDVQDTNVNQYAFFDIQHIEKCSKPLMETGKTYRRLILDPAGTNLGKFIFRLPVILPNIKYEFDITYRMNHPEILKINLLRNDKLENSTSLTKDRNGWINKTITFSTGIDQELLKQSNSKSLQLTRKPLQQRHWPGEGTLIIKSVNILDNNYKEKFIFTTGTPMHIQLEVMAQRQGNFPVRPAITLYRADGLLISNLVSENIFSLDLLEEKTHFFYFDISSINLGIGHYIFSVSLFKDNISQSDRYDLIDRAFEFKVISNNNKKSYEGVVFKHSGQWSSQKQN